MAGGGSKSASKAAGSSKALAVVQSNNMLRGRITASEIAAVGAKGQQVLNASQMQRIADNRSAAQRQRTQSSRSSESNRSRGNQQQQINTIDQRRNAIVRTGQNFRRSGNENALLDSLNRSTRRTNDVINRSNQNVLRAGGNNISRTGNIRDRNNQRKMNRPITRPGQQETILDRLNRPPGAPAPQAQNQIRRLRRGQA